MKPTARANRGLRPLATGVMALSMIAVSLAPANAYTTKPEPIEPDDLFTLTGQPNVGDTITAVLSDQTAQVKKWTWLIEDWWDESGGLDGLKGESDGSFAFPGDEWPESNEFAITEDYACRVLAFAWTLEGEEWDGYQHRSEPITIAADDKGTECGYAPEGNIWAGVNSGNYDEYRQWSALFGLDSVYAGEGPRVGMEWSEFDENYSHRGLYGVVTCDDQEYLTGISLYNEELDEGWKDCQFVANAWVDVPGYLRTTISSEPYTIKPAGLKYLNNAYSHFLGEGDAACGVDLVGNTGYAGNAAVGDVLTLVAKQEYGDVNDPDSTAAAHPCPADKLDISVRWLGAVDEETGRRTVLSEDLEYPVTPEDQNNLSYYFLVTGEGFRELRGGYPDEIGFDDFSQGWVAIDNEPRYFTVGEGLTAYPDGFSSYPDYAYQWLRNGEPIKGAIKYYYVTTTDDEFADISVQVTASRGVYAWEPVTSEAIIWRFDPASSITVPSSIKVEAGSTLKLTGKVEPQGATKQTITWELVKPAQATLKGNQLTASAPETVNLRATVKNGAGKGKDVTRDFSVTVTPISIDGSVTLAAQDAAGKAVSIANAAVGHKVTAKAAFASSVNPGFQHTYQWYRGTDVAPFRSTTTTAATDTYTLAAVDHGKKITVKVTATPKTKANLHAAPLVKDSSIAAVKPAVINGGAIAVTGMPVKGNKLTAKVSGFVPAPGSAAADITYTYEWLKGTKVVQTQTKAGTKGGSDTYTLKAGDEGQISVRVTAKLAGHTNKAVTAKAIAGGKATITPPKVLKVGAKLTAKPSAFNPGDSGVKYTYQWMRTVGGKTTAIARATSSTYTTVKADGGATISVQITATKAGFTPRAVTSAATKAIAK